MRCAELLSVVFNVYVVWVWYYLAWYGGKQSFVYMGFERAHDAVCSMLSKLLFPRFFIYLPGIADMILLFSHLNLRFLHQRGRELAKRDKKSHESRMRNPNKAIDRQHVLRQRNIYTCVHRAPALFCWGYNHIPSHLSTLIYSANSDRRGMSTVSAITYFEYTHFQALAHTTDSQ